MRTLTVIACGLLSVTMLGVALAASAPTLTHTAAQPGPPEVPANIAGSASSDTANMYTRELQKMVGTTWKNESSTERVRRKGGKPVTASASSPTNVDYKLETPCAGTWRCCITWKVWEDSDEDGQIDDPDEVTTLSTEYSPTVTVED